MLLPHDWLLVELGPSGSSMHIVGRDYITGLYSEQRLSEVTGETICMKEYWPVKYQRGHYLT